MVFGDHDNKQVRIWRRTWRAISRIQMEQEAERGRKPTMADVIDQAVTLLEKKIAR